MPTQRREEKRVEEPASAQGRERERESAGAGWMRGEKVLWLLLLCFFLHLGLPYANWASPGVLLVLPEVFTPVLGPSFDLPLFYFRGLFPSLSFSHRHFGLLLPILTT